jgi:hypothetical protein
VQHRNGCFGYNEEGIFAFSGGEPTVVSSKIQSIMDDSINIGQIDDIAGVDADKFILYAMPFGSSSVNNRTLYFDLATGSWSEWTGLRVGSFLMNAEVQSADTLIYADADSGVVYVYGRGYSDTYDLDYLSPFITLQQEDVEKSVMKFQVDAAWDYGDTILVRFYADRSLTTPVYSYNMVSTSPASLFKTYLFHTDGNVRGVSVAVRLTSVSVDTVSVSRIGLYIVPTREIQP